MNPSSVRLLRNEAVMAAAVDLIAAAVKNISTKEVSSSLDGDSLTVQTICMLASARLKDKLDYKRGMKS